MRQGGKPAKEGRKAPQIASLIVDLHCFAVKLARHAAMHAPKIVIGDGQGALIAIGYGIPGVLESALGTRNVQRQEAQEMAEAWGKDWLELVRLPADPTTSY